MNDVSDVSDASDAMYARFIARLGEGLPGAHGAARMCAWDKGI